MLTAYFKSAQTLARYRSGIAGPYLDDFVSWLANRGYQRVSIRRHVREVMHFATWAASVNLAASELDHRTLARLRDHLSDRGMLRGPSGNDHHLYQSACVFTRFLEGCGVVRSAKQPSRSVVPSLYTEFCEWMKAQRGTLDITLTNYRLPVTNLLQSLGEPSTYSAQRLRAFFLQ